jgi:hypothetical protein
MHSTKIKLSYPCNKPLRPIGLYDVEDPTFSRQWALRGRLGCQPYMQAALYPQEHLLVLICVRATVRLGGLGKLKKKINDLMRTRNRIAPADTKTD